VGVKDIWSGARGEDQRDYCLIDCVFGMEI
jgi:hypothetical protein